MKPLEILLLTDFDRRSASTIRDHVRSFGAFSRHRFRRLSIYGDLPPRLDLSRFDGIVIHYTLIACMDNYLSRATRARWICTYGIAPLARAARTRAIGS